MRAPSAPSTPQLRLHPDAAAVEVQALYRGVVIGTRCLGSGDAAPFLIGSAKGVDAPAAAELLSGAAHPLVSLDAQGFSVELTDRMKGTVIFQDRSAPLDELLRAHGPGFVPPPAARLQIACGELAFLVTATVPPTQIPRPPLARLRDHWPALLAGGTMLVFLTFLASLPQDPKAISLDLMAAHTRVQNELRIPTVPPPGETLAAAPGGGAPAVGGGTKVERPDRRPTPPRRGRPPRTVAIDPGRAGILGIFRALDRSAFAEILSKNDGFGTGDLQELDTTGDPFGGGSGIGLAVNGTGAGRAGSLTPGGDGGLQGIGRCDTACQGRARDVLRSGSGRLATRPPREPDVTIGPPHVRGSLDKDIVRRIIRNHLNEVKFCYEQQLPRHPELGGRISVQFIIAPAGSVANSFVQSSTVGNVAVESCIVQAVRRWEFPKPQGGGVVVVSYPFVLVPAGSS